jgi:hypothetical protein
VHRRGHSRSQALRDQAHECAAVTSGHLRRIVDMVVSDPLLQARRPRPGDRAHCARPHGRRSSAHRPPPNDAATGAQPPGPVGVAERHCRDCVDRGSRTAVPRMNRSATSRTYWYSPMNSHHAPQMSPAITPAMASMTNIHAPSFERHSYPGYHHHGRSPRPVGASQPSRSPRSSRPTGQSPRFPPRHTFAAYDTKLARGALDGSLC